MFGNQGGYEIPVQQQSKELRELTKNTYTAEIVKPNTKVYIPAVIQNCTLASPPKSTAIKQVYECHAYSLINPIKMDKTPIQVFVGRDDFIITNPYEAMPAEELVKALERKGYQVSISQNIEGGTTND